MKMLDNLKEILDDLEKKDEWAHGFVQSLLIRQEEGTLGKLTPKQWNKLLEIHERHCVQPSARERYGDVFADGVQAQVKADWGKRNGTKLPDLEKP